MIETPVVIGKDKDFDARPMALLVNEASRYESKVYIKTGNKTINAKSIMGMMSLTLAPGEEFIILTEGVDEEKAAEGIKAFLASF